MKICDTFMTGNMVLGRKALDFEVQDIRKAPLHQVILKDLRWKSLASMLFHMIVL